MTLTSDFIHCSSGIWFKTQNFVLAFHNTNCLFFPFTVKCIILQFPSELKFALKLSYLVHGIPLQCKLILCGSSELTFTPCTQTINKPKQVPEAVSWFPCSSLVTPVESV